MKIRDWIRTNSLIPTNSVPATTQMVEGRAITLRIYSLGLITTPFVKFVNSTSTIPNLVKLQGHFLN